MGNGNRSKYDVTVGQRRTGRQPTGYIDPKGRASPQCWCYLCESEHLYGRPCRERRW